VTTHPDPTRLRREVLAKFSTLSDAEIAEARMISECIGNPLCRNKATEAHKLNSPKNGTVSNSTKNGTVRPGNSTENGTINSTKNGTVRPGNSTENGTLNSTENGTLNSTENGTQNLSIEPTNEPKKKLTSFVSSAETKKIEFDGTQFLHITPGLRDAWQRAYPALSLDAELARAAAWLIANPKNKKSNYARFLTGWLSRAQDRAPRVAAISNVSTARTEPKTRARDFLA
jgi:hypothetical protein